MSHIQFDYSKALEFFCATRIGLHPVPSNGR